MLSIRLSELKEGLVFSKPLLTEDGEILVTANTPIKRTDIINIATMGIYEVYTFGEIVESEKPMGTSIARDKISPHIQILKQNLLKQIDELKRQKDSGHPRAELILQQQELKLDRVEIVEECIEEYARILSIFNNSHNKNIAFVQKISSIVKLLITEVQEHSFSFIDVISTADFGFHLTSHLVKSTIYAIYLCYNLGLNEARTYNTAIGTILHDIGKIAYHKVNEIENIKVSKENMKLEVSHPIYGYKVAKGILRLPEEVCQIILNHHEQLDGKGFPRGITSFNISQGDHICFVANFFEKIVSKIGYEGCSEPLEQLEIIYNNNKTIFEESVVQTLLDLKDR